MSFLRSCLNHLDSFGVRYTHTVDPLACTAEEIPAEENVPAHLVAKAVLCEGDNRYLMVVVPIASYVDIGKVSRAAGARTIRIATESEVAVLFPFSAVSAIPPLGGLIGLPVYLDRQLANQEFIAFTAGSYHDLIHMRTADFRQIAQTTIGTFGYRDYQAEFRKALLAARKAAGV